MAKIVVVDSDAIFALYNPHDSLNTSATKTFQYLLEQQFQIIYPSSVIFEVISLFQRVLPNPTITSTILDKIRTDSLIVYAIDNDILKEAAELFDSNGSKKNTLIDCSVAVVAKKLKANGVFSYDRFYVKHGLKMATEL